ncbi:hypothetical protein GCM10020218_093290 [Dactylosporangium vinaceum]
MVRPTFLQVRHIKAHKKWWNPNRGKRVREITSPSAAKMQAYARVEAETLSKLTLFLLGSGPSGSRSWLALRRLGIKRGQRIEGTGSDQSRRRRMVRRQKVGPAVTSSRSPSLPSGRTLR